MSIASLKRLKEKIVCPKVFTNQIQAMINAPGGIFVDADNERAGNLAYRVQEGNAHDGNAALQYIYNGLIWLWAEEK